MKKYIAAVLCLFIVLSVAACGRYPADGDNTSDKIKIVTTIFPLYDFARQVAGDRAEVIMLLPAGTQSHSYEVTPQDIIKIKESDLFINIGGSADPWTEAVINDADNHNIEILSAINVVDKIRSDDKDASHFEYDEHIWTSPENAEEIVEAISEKLEFIDPRNRAYYERNEEQYTDKLERLDEKFERLTNNSRKKIVFADKFPFKYFADEYRLKYYSAFPGCSSESEPSAASVSKLIDIIKTENINVVFYTETSNQRLADIVCEETGAKKLLLHSCHTVDKNQLENGITYIDLMLENYEALKEALK